MPNSIEELADHAAHERDRYEDRDDGECRRHDRKADLRRSLARGFEVVLPFLHVTDDVLAHDDRVVDQHADGQGEAHQREHVQREAEHPHRDECRDRPKSAASGR
jgi:hypothetical protein